MFLLAWAARLTRRTVAVGNPANDNDGTAASYELGELEIVRHGRASSAQPVTRANPALPEASGAEKRAPQSPRTFTFGDEEMGPALELELDLGPDPAPGTARLGPASPPARPAPPGARGVRPDTAPGFSSGTFASFGDGLDDFDGSPLVALPTIEVEKPITRVQERAAAPKAPADPRQKEREETERVKALADYGDTPRGLVSSGRYAVRVVARTVALRRERRLVHVEVTRLAAAHHEALVAMGRQLLARGGDSRLLPLRDKVARALDEQTKANLAKGSVQDVRDDGERALFALDVEAEEQRRKIAPFVDAERDARTIQERADEAARRARAMQKRAEIELRARSTAEGAVDPGRVAALEMRVAEQSAAAESAARTLAETTEALGQRRRELALAQGALGVIEEKRRGLERAARTREAAAEKDEQAVESALGVALRELAEAALEQQLSDLAQAAAQEVARCEAPLSTAGETLVRFDRALAVYDRGAAFKGLGLLLVLLLLPVVLLVVR